MNKEHKLGIKHLMGLEDISRQDIETIIDMGFTFREILDRPIKKVPILNGKNIVNLFFENSTRTKISFELAEKRLSADVTNFSASSSSVQKGESLKDTIQNIYAMVLPGALAYAQVLADVDADSNILMKELYSVPMIL